jgi:hypothetical protein
LLRRQRRIPRSSRSGPLGADYTHVSLDGSEKAQNASKRSCGTEISSRFAPRLGDPSAHACHTSAVATELAAFFGTDNVSFSLDSRVTGTTREYDRFRDAVKDVDLARVLAGFHFRNSDQEGSVLRREVGRYVTNHFFQPLG